VRDHTQGHTTTTVPAPQIIAWELTRRCEWACRHCRAAASDREYPGELSTAEAFRLLDNIAAFARPTIILTGGEPLLRGDVEEIARGATQRGLRVVLATCGGLLDDERVARLKQAGVQCVSISLDGATSRTHDAFRGREGAFAAALTGIAALQRGGLCFQINTTVTLLNHEELPALLALAERLGAVTFNPFLLVPTGRGVELAGQELSAEQYEQTLVWLARQQRVGGSSGADHWAHERQDRPDEPAGRNRPGDPIRGQTPQGVKTKPHQNAHDPEAVTTGGCLGGKRFAFISHTGRVQICGFLDVPAGELRAHGLDFAAIWRDSELFARVRDVDGYHGKCGYCEFRRVCGGCRARAYALTGDVLGAEPFCVYQPPSVKPGKLTGSESVI